MSSRYVVHRDGTTHSVTVRAEGTGFRVTLDGEELFADWRAIPGSETRSLLIDGRSYEVATQPARDGVDVYVSGDVFHVQVTDELWARAEAGASSAATGREEVRSPMPGSVVAIRVRMGERVEPGDVVAVVEAMKMQNDLAADRGGTVVEIAVEAGAVVDQDQVLVVLDAGDPA